MATIIAPHPDTRRRTTVFDVVRLQRRLRMLRQHFAGLW